MNRFLGLALLLFVAAMVIRTTAQTAQPQRFGLNVRQGQQIFRFDTFGDEQLWTRTLQMHTVLPSVSPKTALSVGLKVDTEALPPEIIAALKAGTVPLNDPAVTLQLLSLNAVVGVIGKVNGGSLTSVGVTCALCHSTVDDSVVPGVGKRLDGWPNTTLNVGAIVALSPVLTDAEKAVFNSWGPGKYDPRMHAFNGTALITLHPGTLPVVLPPAYGLKQAGFETFTADGPISYWNNYVAVTQMGGQGNFSDSRIGLNIVQTPDLVTPKLPALLDYQLSLKTPEPPPNSFDKAAAQRGKQLFKGIARCETCHREPALTDVLIGPRREEPFLHSPFETGMEPVYATRSATGFYRTTPLRGLWQHPPYFHDGSAPTLAAVVEHYDKALSLGLTSTQKAELVEYLKSL